MAHAADLLTDRCRVRISLEGSDDLGALLRRKPFSVFCPGKRDARSSGNSADRHVAHAADLLSGRCRVRIRF